MRKCLRCGAEQEYSPWDGRCKVCSIGILEGFTTGGCMVRGCQEQAVAERYLSDGCRRVRECAHHAGRGRRFEFPKRSLAW